MPKLRFPISISLDGYSSGPDQSVDNPLGIGGEALHGWVVALATWRKQHGLEGVPDLHGLRLVRTLEAPGVAHLKFARG